MKRFHREIGCPGQLASRNNLGRHWDRSWTKIDRCAGYITGSCPGASRHSGGMRVVRAGTCAVGQGYDSNLFFSDESHRRLPQFQCVSAVEPSSPSERLRLRSLLYNPKMPRRRPGSHSGIVFWLGKLHGGSREGGCSRCRPKFFTKLFHVKRRPCIRTVNGYVRLYWISCISDNKSLGLFLCLHELG